MNPDHRLVVFDHIMRQEEAWSLSRRGLQHPIPSIATIDWDKHQEPQVWEALLRQARYARLERSWYVPAPLKRLGRLVGNRLFNYFTFSLFTIRARRSQVLD